MFADITQPPKALPRADLKQLSSGITLLPPLSRRGTGPGLIVLVPKASDILIHEGGVPSQLNKWAEEGFTVAQIETSTLTQSSSAVADAIAALKACDKYEETGKIGLVAYDAQSWNTAASSLPSEISAAIIYANQGDAASLAKSPVATLHHLAGAPPAEQPPVASLKNFKSYNYPAAKSHGFASPLSDDFSYSLEAVSHTRTLQFMKPVLGGPYFDLEYIWDGRTWNKFNASQEYD